MARADLLSIPDGLDADGVPLRAMCACGHPNGDHSANPSGMCFGDYDADGDTFSCDCACPGFGRAQP